MFNTYIYHPDQKVMCITMSSSSACVDEPNQVIKTFNNLINTVPETEEEAEHIIIKVEKMLLEYPSLSKYLRFDPQEHKVLLNELKLMQLID